MAIFFLNSNLVLTYIENTEKLNWKFSKKAKKIVRNEYQTENIRIIHNFYNSIKYIRIYGTELPPIKINET